MFEKLTNNEGFTLVELMLALAVFSILFLAIVETHVIFQKYWVTSSKEISYQSAGRMTAERIAKAVRRASSITVTDSASQTDIEIQDVSGDD